MSQLEQDLKKIFNLIKINDFSLAKKELEINLNLHPNNYKIVLKRENLTKIFYIF